MLHESYNQFNLVTDILKGVIEFEKCLNKCNHLPNIIIMVCRPLNIQKFLLLPRGKETRSGAAIQEMVINSIQLIGEIELV